MVWVLNRVLVRPREFIAATLVKTQNLISNEQRQTHAAANGQPNVPIRGDTTLSPVHIEYRTNKPFQVKQLTNDTIELQ
jgi:hypothetical protein